MMNASGYQAYKKTQVQTADPGTLILLCYDGALSFLKKGKQAMLGRDIKNTQTQLNKAQNVLWELIHSINFETGEIAYNLESLYNYMIRRIMDAQAHNTTDGIDEVINYMEELKASWEKIVRKQ